MKSNGAIGGDIDSGGNIAETAKALLPDAVANDNDGLGLPLAVCEAGVV